MKTMSLAEICYVFDELISRSHQVGNAESDNLIEYLEKIKNKELFIVDVFRSKGVVAQKSKMQERVDFSQSENDYIPVFKSRPSFFAKKWFPYKPIFESFDVHRMDWLERYELSLRLVILLRIINRYVRDSEAYSESDKASISEILLFETIDNRDGRLELDKASLAEFQLIEKILHEYIEEAGKSSIKKFFQYEQARFNKKIREYKYYIQDLITNFGDLYAISIDFWWDVPANPTNIQKSDLKKKFFNNLRSHSDFEVIKGYVGLWEYSAEKALYFRCIFFCTKSKMHSIDYTIEGLISYWEQGFASKSDERSAGKVIYSAELSPLAYSKSSLNQHTILLNSKNKALLEDFYNIVLNYIIISEKYYYPIELQIELLAFSPILHQKENDDSGFSLKKYGPSRSFRGHLRRPKN